MTGGSRGIGAGTALALADHGYDVALTYRNKAARANEVVTAVTQRGVRGLALACDMTRSSDVEQLFHHLKQWTDHLDVVILNASGGMERDLVEIDPDYAMHINRDAQLLLIDAALPLLASGGVIVFVTSHRAHLYGQMKQLPACQEPHAESKYAGEQALRTRQEEFAARGIRLLVVTGDLVEGTITPKLLERTTPGLIDQRRTRMGALPTATEMGKEIALTVMDTSLPTGSTVVVGAPLQSMLSLPQGALRGNSDALYDFSDADLFFCQEQPASQYLSNTPGLGKAASRFVGRLWLCHFADRSQACIP